GIAPGGKVADFIMGGGYWTRILAPVVGPKGKVYAYQPAEFIQFRAAYADDPRVKLLTLENGGKARALNQGLALARGDIVIALDADTQ
ncbi:glycosyltransferase, partial [Escherichia coli]|uniref:glycosyltransferase n=1 Tax=Escherichia coli TaxID=562 RepID=UPI0015C49F7F